MTICQHQAKRKAIAMVIFHKLSQPLPLPLTLPWRGLPDSLDTLSTVASQLQWLITTALAHPFWAVVALVLSIGLIQLIADLVKRIIRASLTFVLTLPLRLSQWIWKRATATPKAIPQTPSAKIDQLLIRLEALRQEQDQVIAELKTLLPTTTTVPDTSHTQPEADDSAPLKTLPLGKETTPQSS
ncbi:MAG: hypothetical protein AAFY72_04510 [Cyanobacteria bacterium J06649_4]